MLARSVASLAHVRARVGAAGTLPLRAMSTIPPFEPADLAAQATELSAQEAIQGRHDYLSPSLGTFQAFREPFVVKGGRMQYIYDQEGRRYLDLLAQNLCVSVGHNHPNVVGHVKEQLDKMVHCTTMYYNETNILAGKELIDTMPEGDWVVHFVNSGSEAIDLAILLARAYTGNYDILALRNSYHGLHSTAMAVTGLHSCKQNFPHAFGVNHVMNPDMLRGPFAKDPDAVEKYAQEVKNVITYETCGEVAGFLFEQVQGFGGIHHLPNGYLPKACAHARDAGALIIADEVQSGFGRMGTHFWSFELQDIVPDIVVTAKGLGNGFPIAAVIVKREIANSMTHKSFFNTYGGNPTVTAAARGVLETLREDNVMEHARVVGGMFHDVLKRLQSKYDCLGDVRGMGLMYGVDIVTDSETNEPDPVFAADVFENMRHRGVIMGLGSIYKNTLRVMPPMCVTKEDSEFLEDVFTEALDEELDRRAGSKN